jgi:hypothetical protein
VVLDVLQSHSVFPFDALISHFFRIIGGCAYAL